MPRLLRRIASFGLIVTFAVACGAGSNPAGASQASGIGSMRTPAERSGFEQTTRYDDVVELMEAFAEASDRLHLTTFGYTYEGRPMPMMVVGNVADASPEAVLASGKTRVWVQGGIHSGEACGKEAMLIMLRELAQGAHAEWDDSLVLMIAPLYNADGNERVKVDNRGRQNGPLGGMGQRPNAQGYDLNRDHMKLDSPEARSLVGMMNAYDPHVAIDLHTTNGTQHAYYVTYSPPLNPNTNTLIDEMLRGDWLPTLTATVKDKHGWDYYYYGNASGGFRGRGGRGRGGRAGAGAEAGSRGGAAGAAGTEPMRAWRTFDHRPRFNNNYVGLRNRFALLSEAYSYATFEDRVMGSLWFVEEALHYAAANAQTIREMTAAADAHSVVGEQLAVRSTIKRADEPVEILMGTTEEILNPYSGQMIRNRLDESRPVTMYEEGAFEASASETVPYAYFIQPTEREALMKLSMHGLRMDPIGPGRTLPGERFVITSSTASEREFQGHNERTLEGRWEAAEITLPAETMILLLDQPLGRLAFTLLEPMSDDGLTNWNAFDRSLNGTDVFPVLRTTQEIR